MTSLIILLWTCGWVVSCAAFAIGDGELYLGTILLLLLTSPIMAVVIIGVSPFVFADKIIWKASK